MAGQVVLFSGGMDSTIALYWAIERAAARRTAAPVHAIAFNYGQRHENELIAARDVWQLARSQPFNAGLLGYFRTVEIPYDMIPRVGSLMTSTSVRTYEGGKESASIDPAFIPHRNLLLLTIAAMWARSWGAKTLVTGLRGGFPDCTEEFEEELASVLRVSDPDHKIEIRSPMHQDRADGVRLANKLQGCMEALAYSLTCFEGTSPPCGKCLPCTKRAEGFKAAGVVDPLLARLQAV